MTTRRWGPALFAVLLLSGITLGAPPKLTIPAEVKPAGQYVDFVPDTDAVSVTYVGLDGIDPVPSRRLAEKTAFLLDTYGKPAKKYRFAAVASSKDGEQTRADFVVVIGDPAEPPPVVTPPPGTDPPKPTPTPANVYYFVLIRSDGPTAPEFTRVVDSEAWAKLTKAGHKFKPKTLSEASALGIKLEDGTKLPAVAVLQENAQTGKSRLVTVLEFPKTDAEIETLPKGVK